MGRCAASDERSHQCGEERIGSVQHPGKRGRHALFRERKHAQGKRKPKDAEPYDVTPIGPVHGFARRWKQREREKANADAEKGDAIRINGAEDFVDE